MLPIALGRVETAAEPSIPRHGDATPDFPGLVLIHVQSSTASRLAYSSSMAPLLLVRQPGVLVGGEDALLDEDVWGWAVGDLVA